MQLFFKAMRENTLLKVLAEPNLVALNGQTAKFVVGGEFPIPIPQGVGGAVTIEFKEFGIRLSFQPTVIGRQMIRLKVEPEVSEIDFSTTVVLTGFSVPGLKKRSAQTTIEMASGSTIAIAGLLSEQVRSFARKVPGVGDVPVLGALFSSVEYKRELTDLVILVTPELVSAMHPDQVSAVPGQHVTSPSDWQLFGLGMLEGEPPCDDSVPNDALNTDIAPRYRKFSGSSPEEMSLHGPWGPENSGDNIVQ
jgi:pilus assembly protein CpaC